MDLASVVFLIILSSAVFLVLGIALGYNMAKNDLQSEILKEIKKVKK